VTLYGGTDVIEAARRALPGRPLLRAALDDLAWLAQRVESAHPEVTLGFDLADIGGNGYYSGVRFAAYLEGSPDAVARGGRYDEVGAAIRSCRAAVGFSLERKVWRRFRRHSHPVRPSLRHGRKDAALRQRVRELREQGHTVVRVLPGHEDEAPSLRVRPRTGSGAGTVDVACPGGHAA